MNLDYNDITMDEIMRRWPQTIRVILGYGMTCVGCPIATFHTIVDAAREHNLDEKSLLDDIMAAINSTAR